MDRVTDVNERAIVHSKLRASLTENLLGEYGGLSITVRERNQTVILSVG